MADTAPQPEPPKKPLRQIMDERGIDMSWYDKAPKLHKLSGTPTIEDKICGRFSIYLLDKSGKLWTIDSDGKPYTPVRETGKQIARDIYICMCCKAYAGTKDVVHKSEGIKSESDGVNSNPDEG